MAKTMAHLVLPQLQLLLCVHNAEVPRAEEWNAYIEAFRTLDVEKVRQFVATDGGSPNTAQRDQINKLVAGRPHKVAVVTPSAMVRGVVTALSWFNPKVQAFSPERIETAFKHIDVKDNEVVTVLAAVRSLRTGLGDNALKCIPATL